MNGHEEVPLDAETLRYLRRLARSPDLWRLALIRTTRPLPHPADCPCVADHIARLMHARPDAALDPDYQSDPEEAAMPLFKKHQSEGPPTLPCRECGVAVEVEPRAVGWTVCPVCVNASHRELLAMMLAAVGIETPADDPAVGEAVGRRLYWRASTSPAASVRIDRSGRDMQGQSLGTPGDYSAPRGSGTDQPWAHVDAKAVRKSISAARARLHPTPRRNKSHSPCAGCGIHTATRWTQTRPGGGLRPMLLCPECSAPWLSLYVAGSPAEAGEGGYHPVRDWRDALCGQALGLPRTVPGLAHFVGFSIYADTADVAADGYGDRFGYISADLIEQARQSVWSRWQFLSPPEYRERQRRRREAEALVLSSTPAPTPTKGTGLAPPRAGS